MIGKRVIISFNTKNNSRNVSKNALDSVENACIRWNADRIIITKPLQPDEYHDMFTKLYLSNVIRNYNMCMYLDTDIIINDTAPNPFKIYNNPECIYVIKDMQQSFLSNEVKNNFKNTTLCMPWFGTCKNALKIDLDPNFYKNNFFNAGVFMFSPRNHHFIFSKIQESIKYIPDSYKQIHQVEQAMLNYAFMYYLKHKLIYIPQTWNFIDPPIQRKEMEGYIYHFTGWYYKEYKNMIDIYTKWRHKV